PWAGGLGAFRVARPGGGLHRGRSRPASLCRGDVDPAWAVRQALDASHAMRSLSKLEDCLCAASAGCIFWSSRGFHILRRKVMLRKLTAGLFTGAVLVLALGCSGGSP